MLLPDKVLGPCKLEPAGDALPMNLMQQDACWSGVPGLLGSHGHQQN